AFPVRVPPRHPARSSAFPHSRLPRRLRSGGVLRFCPSFHFMEMSMAKRSQRQAAARHDSDAEIHALFPKGGPTELFDEDGRDKSYVRRVRPQSDNQRRLMDAIDRHNLVMALGPA